MSVVIFVLCGWETIMNSASSGHGERLLLVVVTVNSRRGHLRIAANLIECRLQDGFLGVVFHQAAAHVKMESDMVGLTKLFKNNC